LADRRPKIQARSGPKRASGTDPEVVRVKLLGGFSVSVGPRTVEESAWRRKKAAALVQLLALAPTHSLHREQAMDLLWPDSGRRAAANSLRQALHAARRAISPDPAAGSHYVRSNDEQILLCPERRLWVDVDWLRRTTF
jgi:DNA-binding SARP family transcriptional activator